MVRYKWINLLIAVILLANLLFTNIALAVDAITVPEKDINLKIENLTRGCKIYLLLSEDLLRYNMEQFINYNLNNVYQSEAEKAQKIQNYLNESDYLGYVEYFKSLGFNQVEENEVELRHYCFSMQSSEIIGEYEHEGKKYIQIKVNLDEENRFKLIIKDYLVDYNSLDTKFMIDEYGTITFIDLNNLNYEVNPEKNNIEECNVNYTYYEENDFSTIEENTKIAYRILYIVLAIILIIIIILIVRHYIKLWKEKEARKFWKKKLTKEEKKEEKRKRKEEKKLEKSKKVK